MINYKPFFQTLEEKNITLYTLTHKYGFSSNLIHRMRHNLPLTTTTLDDLCSVLDCGIEDIVMYTKDEE